MLAGVDFLKKCLLAEFFCYFLVKFKVFKAVWQPCSCYPFNDPFKHIRMVLKNINTVLSCYLTLPLITAGGEF